MFNIFISDLRKYNEGELTGAWFDLETPEGLAEANKEIDRILSGGSEYFVSDWESDWTNLNYFTCSIGGLGDIEDSLYFLHSLDDNEKELYKAISASDMFDKQTIESIIDNQDFIGIVKDGDTTESPFLLFAYQKIEDEYYTDDLINMYFDYEAYANDLRHDYELVELSDEYIFIPL